MKTIDMTPTFEQATAMCITILDNSTNEDARQNARAELLRYARQYDALIAHVEAQEA